VRRTVGKLVGLALGSLTLVGSAGAAAACDLAIVGARLYASPEAAPVARSTVEIVDGRISAVHPDGRAAPPGCPSVDAGGKVLVAGFWNSHVHLLTPVLMDHAEASDAAVSQELTDKFLRWGFTTVFDLASTTESATGVRARVESGRVRGPRIRTVGAPFFPQGGTPIYARPIYAQYGLPLPEVASPEAGADRVGTQAAEGIDGIKLFTGAIVGETEVLPMPLDVTRALSEAAHPRGLPVFAHPTNAEGLARAVEGGADVLAHSAALMGPWSEVFALDLAERKVALVPTLALFALHPHPSTPVATSQQQVAALRAAGGDILFGTDAGFMDEYDTTLELRLLGDVMDWRGVLAALTTAPAARLGRAGETGRVEPGAVADLVLLDADPAQDVTAFSRVGLVLKDGQTVYQAPAPAP
jgi:Imidazolonepropionase and related amidohydrolases